MTSRLSRDLDHILSHTQGLWEEFRGQTIFITGGTGFFGTWLLESWVYANDKLGLNAKAWVLTRDPKSFEKKAPHLAAHPSVRLLAGDVRNFDFPDQNFSHVIHAATPASAKLNAEAPLLMFDTVVDGTRRVLDLAVKAGAKKFLLTSSGAVYGRQPTDLARVPEDYIGAPDSLDTRAAYGVGKRAAEHLCALYQKRYGIETKIARCYAFVGPHLPLDVHFAIGNFIRDGLAKQTIQIKGDGTPLRSYLYAADLVIWLWTILTKGQASRAYNVGSERDVSIGELGKVIAKYFDVGLEIAMKPAPGQPAERYVPLVQRAKKELGLKEWISLEDGIDRTVEWNRL